MDKKFQSQESSQVCRSNFGDVTIAPNGDIFATGRFYDSISFGSIPLTSTGLFDCWTAKLSPDGQWMWAEALRGNEDYSFYYFIYNFDWIWGHQLLQIPTVIR